MKCKSSIPENFISLNDSLQNFWHDFPTYWLLPLPHPTTWWLSRWPGSCRPELGVVEGRRIIPDVDNQIL